MDKKLKSDTVTQGAKMAGARALWMANGMKREHFGQPIIAVANSFTQFVPGHVHLHQAGQLVKQLIEESGCFAAEFNTIAIDDGIAMGHSGMLYSLPSREIIADSVEYMCNAHCADALICISNCDKITPGMLMAAMRLNIPTIFVSGGPMEAGLLDGKKYDLVDAMVAGGVESISTEELTKIENSACPTCGSCSGMFTANSMNCLTEALGFSLPGNGTVVATHQMRVELLKQAATRIVEMAKKCYFEHDNSVLPRNVANRSSFLNSMRLDLAMGGSTNTILHLLAIAHEGEVDFTLKDVEELSKTTPCLCKVSPNSSYHIEDVNRAGGVLAIMNELKEANLLDLESKRADGFTLKEALSNYDLRNMTSKAVEVYGCAPARKRSLVMGSQNCREEDFDLDRENGVIRSVKNSYTKDGGLAVLFGNIALKGAVVKTAGIGEELFYFKGRAKVFHSQEETIEAILGDKIVAGDVVVIIYEGPKGGPGMQEMLYPTSYLKSKKLDKVCALLTDGRFSGGTSGLSIGHASPEAAQMGAIALVQNGDLIEIDIRNRSLNLLITADELQKRAMAEKTKEYAYKPNRERTVSKSLQIYAQHVTSADCGAVRTV